jgi:hypothetical protein
MNWERDIVRATVEGAGPYAHVQLAFVLCRLERVPGGKAAVIAAIRDMAKWYDAHALELENEGIALANVDDLFARAIRRGAGQSDDD